MITKLDPVGISVSFPTGTYRLRDTVSIRIEVYPRTDVTVAEARVGLECHIHYTEMSSGISRKTAGNRGSAVMTDTATKIMTESVDVEQVDIFDSFSFLTDQQLKSGRAITRDVRLKIPSNLGENATALLRGTRVDFSWRVVVTADVSLDQNVIETMPIDIVLSGRSRN